MKKNKKPGSSWCHNIVALSHLWLAEDHPDPLGSTLKRLERGLTCLMSEFDGDFGVFWDFLSLHQKKGRQPRNEVDQEKFEKGLALIPFVFLCPSSIVFQVKDIPTLDGLHMEGQSRLPFEKRGWPFSEQCWSTIDKRYSGSTFNLSLLHEDDNSYRHLYDRCAINGTGLPLERDQFCKEIHLLSFGRSGDREKVKKLYKDSFENFKKTKVLIFGHLNWSSGVSQGFFNLVNKNFASCLVSLDVSHNQLTPRVCSNLERCFENEKLENLKEVNLSYNPIGDHGVSLLCSVFLRLTCLKIRGVGLSALGCQLMRARVTRINRSQESFTRPMDATTINVEEHQDEHLGIAIVGRTNHALELREIDAGENQIGDGGVSILGKMFKNIPILKLDSTECSEVACTALSSLSPKWQHLDIGGNRICIAGRLISLVEASPSLTRLNIKGNVIRKRSMERLRDYCSQSDSWILVDEFSEDISSKQLKVSVSSIKASV